MKRVYLIGFILLLICMNVSPIFASNSSTEYDSISSTAEEQEILKIFHNAIQSTDDLILGIKDIAVGDVYEKSQVLYDSNGNQIGYITIVTTKVAEPIQPYSIGFQDYWRADGKWSPSASTNIVITSRTGTTVTAERTFAYTYDSGQGGIALPAMHALLETGVRILPSDPGYVRVWLEINDGA